MTDFKNKKSSPAPQLPKMSSPNENKILKKPVFLRKLLQKYGLCRTINLGLYKPK